MKYPMGSYLRHKLIESRFSKPAFNSIYEPGQRASRDEGPTISQISTIYSPRIGREIHTLSSQEERVAILLLYSPNLIDLHEQRPLSIFPAEHPFAGHPATAGMTLMPVRGTAFVAEALQMLDRHPRIREGYSKKVGDKNVDNPYREHNGKLTYYLGDFLMLHRDEKGVYAKNITVKARMQDFFKSTNSLSMRKIRNAMGRKQADDARYLLEEAYYRDAQISTSRVAASSIDETVSTNLRLLACYAAQPTPKLSRDKEVMIARYQEALSSRQTAMSTFESLMKDFNCKREACLTVFYQAIWRRELRLDLFRTILVDKPLVPESRDVLDEYADWFRR